MTTDWILGWWNLIFIVPFGLALTYLLLYAASGITFGDADHDVGGDHDAGGDHEAGGDHDSDHDTDTAGSASPMRLALLWLGVGRVPLSVLLMVFLLAWGAAGFCVNELARPVVSDPWLVVAYSLPAALLTAALTTRLTVRAIAKWIPLDETTARRRHDLLGLAGVAMYPVDAKFGMVSVRDDRGELYQVPCRVEPGADPIPKNARAVLVAYNAKENLYRVVPEEQAAEAKA